MGRRRSAAEVSRGCEEGEGGDGRQRQRRADITRPPELGLVRGWPRRRLGHAAAVSISPVGHGKGRGPRGWWDKLRDARGGWRKLLPGARALAAPCKPQVQRWRTAGARQRGEPRLGSRRCRWQAEEARKPRASSLRDGEGIGEERGEGELGSNSGRPRQVDGGSGGAQQP